MDLARPLQGLDLPAELQSWDCATLAAQFDAGSGSCDASTILGSKNCVAGCEEDPAFFADACPLTVLAAQGRLSGLSVSHRKSVLYRAFVWARRALNIPKRRFLARAVCAVRAVHDHGALRVGGAGAGHRRSRHLCTNLYIHLVINDRKFTGLHAN